MRKPRIKATWVGRQVSKITPITETKRIAIVGSGNSGKTVFMTSLLDHLRNHDPQLLRLDNMEIIGNYSGPLQPGLTGRPGHSRALWSVGVLECWSLNIGHHYSALRLSGIELRNKRIAMEQTGQGIHGTNSIFAGR